jgi:proteasome assembly chaperone (PAC2) family protein
MDRELRKPWLVAVWPGMGGVAQIAGTYLVRALDMQPLAELDARPFHATQSIAVKDGLVQPPDRPRSVFYAWRNPGEGRDLIVMLADQQPSVDAARYGEALLDVAARHGVERVFTFAAMATPAHPSAEPRVFAVVTEAALLADIDRARVTRLQEGEITGLNGVFVTLAAARSLPGTCLLGEFPFFAATVPNPKASAAVLRVFSELSGIEIGLAELLADARRIEKGLIEHLENLQNAAQLAARSVEPAGEEGERTDEPELQDPFVPAPEVVKRIEELFAQARRDRARALELKTELDRHGLFRQYEDRFLDLFKKAS